MIAVDASALVAIAAREPDQDAYLSVLRAAESAHLSEINYVEVGTILIRRGLIPNRERLNDWLAELGVELAHASDLGSRALAAYLRFGKGFHPARLNLADCFAYALAKTLDVPLLYKGDDFARTDIRPALQPT